MDDTADGRDPHDSDDELTVRVSPSFTGGVGYGTVFDCRVVAVPEGNIEQDSFSLTVLPKDDDIEEVLSSNESPAEVVLQFVRRGENESSKLLPITGFVDENATSWEVVDVRVDV